MNIRNKQWYGWTPDLPDPNDFRYKVSQPVFTLKSSDLIKEYDLYRTSPCYNQGNLGSCTGNGIAFIDQVLFLKDHKEFMPARLFIYYGERRIEGTINYDSGAQIRDGIKVLNQVGVCAENLVPYNIQDFRNKPSNAAYYEASRHKIKEYTRLDNRNLAELVDCLNQGFPFVFGFTVFSSFESEAVAKTGIMPIPLPGEAMLGGHCTVAVGFNADTNMFTVRNSWGTDWGIQGYFQMPASFMINPSYVSDCWMITKRS